MRRSQSGDYGWRARSPRTIQLPPKTTAYKVAQIIPATLHATATRNMAIFYDRTSCVSAGSEANLLAILDNTRTYQPVSEHPLNSSSSLLNDLNHTAQEAYSEISWLAPMKAFPLPTGDRKREGQDQTTPTLDSAKITGNQEKVPLAPPTPRSLSCLLASIPKA